MRQYLHGLQPYYRHVLGTIVIGSVCGLIMNTSVVLMESARAVKRWCLERTIPRMRTNIQADAFRGVLAWPMERVHTTPIGGVMARIVGDVEVIRRGTDQLTVEVWDTFLMLFSLAV